MTAALRPQRGARAIYVVAGGNHVAVVLDRDETGGELDVVEVTARTGGGPPPHRHAFSEWFRVLDGELTFCEERDGEVVPTNVLVPGGSVWVSPWTPHATLNLGTEVARFEVISRPGVMSGYVLDAGVRVPDERTAPDREPPGPAELGAIAERWGIEFVAGGAAPHA